MTRITLAIVDDEPIAYERIEKRDECRDLFSPIACEARRSGLQILFERHDDFWSNRRTALTEIVRFDFFLMLQSFADLVEVRSEVGEIAEAGSRRETVDLLICVDLE